MMENSERGAPPPPLPPLQCQSPARDGVQLNLKGHCLFCLQPQSFEMLLEVADKNPGLKKDLQPIIHYLIGEDPNHSDFKSGISDFDDDGLPPMTCPSCYDMLEELHRLHQKLLKIRSLIQEQTQLARNMIVANIQQEPRLAMPMSKKSKRGQFYSKIRASGMPSEEVAAVIKFVGNLHDRIIFKASVKNEMDCCTPPRASPGHPNQSGLHRSEVAEADGDINIKSEKLEDKEMEEEGEEHDPFKELDDDAPPDDEHPSSPPDIENVMRSILSEANDPPSAAAEESESDEDPQNDDSDEDYIPTPASAGSSSRRAPKRKQPSSGIAAKANKRMKNEGTNSSKSGTPKKIRNRTPTVRRRPELIRPLVVDKDNNTTSQYCDLCGELHPSSLIQRHLETQHGVQDFIAKCPNPSCPYVFSSSGKLDKHLRFGGQKKNKCLQTANIPIKRLLRKKCELCGFKTRFRLKLRTHLERHEVEMPQKLERCPISSCSNKYALRQSVDEHLFTHDEEDQLRKTEAKGMTTFLSCHICGKWLPCSEMEGHFEEIHNLQDYVTKCQNPACPKIFSCRGKMEIHVRGDPICRAATGGRLTTQTDKCDTCGLEVQRKQFLYHLEAHEYQLNDKILSCPIPGCQERYALRQRMEDHIMTHDLRLLSSTQECSLCNHSVNIEDMEGHLKDHHGILQIIPCKRCPFLFHDWESLLDHLELHRSRKRDRSGRGGLACDLCVDSNPGIKFSRYDILRQHFFNVHQIGKKYICVSCEMEFFSQRQLSLHEQNAHSSNPEAPPPEKKKSKKKYSCDLCPLAIFSHPDLLLSHNIKMHGAPHMKCKFCDETFAVLASWRAHEKLHLGLQRTYTCKVEGCGKVYKSHTSLKDHQRVSHSSDDNPSPKFMCETCGKEYKQQHVLRNHVDKIHLGIKKEEGPRPICETCGESFHSGASLRRHTLIHTGERPHGCLICGQAFRTKEVLNTHVKGHLEKGDSFKPNGPMKNVRKRVNPN